jgi:hypothetical protein
MNENEEIQNIETEDPSETLRRKKAQKRVNVLLIIIDIALAILVIVEIIRRFQEMN